MKLMGVDVRANRFVPLDGVLIVPTDVPSEVQALPEDERQKWILEHSAVIMNASIENL
jgi:hypothetical protein